MTDKIQLFLANLQWNQELNEALSQLNEQQKLISHHRTVTTQLDTARAPFRDEYQRLAVE